MIFSWLRQRRRRRILARPFPDDWLTYLERHLPQYEYLSSAEQAKLRDDLRVFVAEKNWEGCNGLTVNDEMKVAIAAQACYMVLALDGGPLDGVISILIYPTAYKVPVERWQQGWSISGEEARFGESWCRGPVVLSWADVRRDAQRSGQGQNLVWHEFAHQLDNLDRSSNGTPPLADPAERRRWHEVMTAEYEQLLDDAETGRATLLDTYGAQNEAEFFAVATECFFDSPVDMAIEHPSLYELLSTYYRQDPAARMRHA